MPTKKTVKKKRVAVKSGSSKKALARRTSKTTAKKGGTTKKSATKRTRRVSVKDADAVTISQPAAIPLIMYRRIALTFIVLVAAALLAVLYLSTVQAVITVTSTEEPVRAEFVANVYEVPTRDTDVRGVVLSGTLGQTQTFEVSGDSMVELPGVATGTVTITNTLSFAQPLVATTRLLSESGVLFRLEDGVTVPAGGSVLASVYADEEGAAGNIEPTTFTIPGLSAVRQAAVMASSAQAFTGGVRMVSAVSQEEIDAAVASLESTLMTDAQAMLRTEAGDGFAGESFDLEFVDQEVSVEAGAEVSSFDVTLTVNVLGVFYDKDALAQIAIAKLYEGLGQGQEFINVNAENVQTRVEGVDEEAGQANILVSLSVPAVTSATSEALQVGRFGGLTEQEVEDLLVEEGIASDVSIEFFPFWVKTVPRLRDHIYINIE